jgi:hypothetical protein
MAILGLRDRDEILGSGCGLVGGDVPLGTAVSESLSAMAAEEARAMVATAARRGGLDGMSELTSVMEADRGGGELFSEGEKGWSVGDRSERAL